jgi:mevalonate kinase
VKHDSGIYTQSRGGKIWIDSQSLIDHMTSVLDSIVDNMDTTVKEMAVATSEDEMETLMVAMDILRGSAVAARRFTDFVEMLQNIHELHQWETPEELLAIFEENPVEDDDPTFGVKKIGDKDE